MIMSRGSKSILKAIPWSSKQETQTKQEPRKLSKSEYVVSTE